MDKNGGGRKTNYQIKGRDMLNNSFQSIQDFLLEKFKGVVHL